MKKYIALFCLLLFLSLPIPLAHAEEGYSDLFISVGDALMKTKADDWSSVDLLIKQLTDDWKLVDQSNSTEATEVEKKIELLHKAVKKKDKQQMLDALADVAHALIALEKEQNPVDEEAQREVFEDVFRPGLNDLKIAVESEKIEEANLQYKHILAIWGKNELIVREQSIAYYGKIETQLGFLRIALSQDEQDFEKMRFITSELIGAVDAFLVGDKLQVIDEGHSLQTLVDLLTKANDKIDEEKADEAVFFLEEFITVWPSVEGEVRTRDGGLYTKLENEIPIIASKLSSQDANFEEQGSKIKALQQSIALIQKKTSYSIWDAALIMLREGLEALLIIVALLGFLRKANVPEKQKWIWLGAFCGLVLSIVAAVVITFTFSVATAGANRELIEGVTGIVAVIMMIGVGMWLHQKATVNSWNHYIKQHMTTAVSTGSIASMAFISFLSIFREGAETIIFYMGMAPSMTTTDLLLGIGLASLILVVFGFVFIRYSTNIAVVPFFKIATVLIYVVAFKVVGVSIHALQLTGHISTTQIYSLPIVNVIGFYPTWETLMPQALLIVLIIIVAIKIRKNENNASAQFE